MTQALTIGLIHPGEMGASLGAALKPNVHRVLWAAEGRSPHTHRRAQAAGVEDVGALPVLAEQSDMIISICPPHAAEDVAQEVAALGFDGVYVDANAIAPQRAERIAGLVTGAGARFVDGGIVGRPVAPGSDTRMYLSCEDASMVADCFAGSALGVIVLPGPAGQASAMKAAYASYTKGAAALTLGILALAHHYGLTEALETEWAKSQPGLFDWSTRQAGRNAPKAWRYTGEMQELADTFAALGLPRGFHEGAEDIYGRLSGYAEAAKLPSAAEVIDVLLGHRMPER